MGQETGFDRIVSPIAESCASAANGLMWARELQVPIWPPPAIVLLVNTARGTRTEIILIFIKQLIVLSEIKKGPVSILR